MHYTAQGSGSQDNHTNVENWKIGATAHLTVRVDWNDHLGWYEGTVLDGHVSLEDRHEEVSPYSSSLLRTSADEDLAMNWDGTPRRFVIQVNRNKQYALFQIDPLVNAQQITQTNSTVNYDAIQAVPWYNGEDAGYVYHSVATGVKELTGNYDSVGWSQYPLTGNIQPKYTWHVEYSFQPTGQSEDDEVVVTSDTYDDFRPEAASAISSGRRSSTPVPKTRSRWGMSFRSWRPSCWATQPPTPMIMPGRWRLVSRNSPTKE